MPKILTETPENTTPAPLQRRPGIALFLSLFTHGLMAAALIGWAQFFAVNEPVGEFTIHATAKAEQAEEEEVEETEVEEATPPKPESQPRKLNPELIVVPGDLPLLPPIDVAAPTPAGEIIEPPTFVASFELPKPEPKPEAKPTPKPVAKTKPKTASPPAKRGTPVKKPTRPTPKTVAATPIRRSSPVYPSSAKKSGHQGTTLLTATVSTSGKVGATRISKSSGYSSLDQAAQAALRRWKFRPASRGGVAVVSQVQVPIAFRLR